jgi:hypothetical protein
LEVGNVFVLDQHSTDNSRELAAAQLGANQVISVPTGTVGDIQQAIQYFGLAAQQQWLFIAPANTAFGPNYFRLFARGLHQKRHVTALGSVQTLHANWLGAYRDLAYALARSLGSVLQLAPNRIQTLENPVIGLRIDIVAKLKPETRASDFDVCMQCTRLGLGKTLRLRRAVSYVPRPATFREFYRQTLDQQRMFFQTIRQYRVGFHWQAIDIVIGYQLLQTATLLAVMGLLLPLALSRTDSWWLIPALIFADYLLNTLLILGICYRRHNRRLLRALPYAYILRWVEIGIYIRAFIEVIGFDRFTVPAKTIEDMTQALDTVATSSPK